GLRSTGFRPGPGSLPRDRSNVFAGRDGRVYRQGTNGWEVHDGAGWRGIGTRNPGLPRPTAPAAQPGRLPPGRLESPARLDRAAAARSTSAARAGSRLAPPAMDRGGSSPRPSSGGGAFGGFGRRTGLGGGGFGGGGRGGGRR